MNESDRPIAIHGIVPAAGLSRRMGRTKQSLPFGTSTVTGTVVRTMLRAGVDTLVVVCRTDLAEGMDLPEDKRLTVIFNDDPSSQMIDSIRLALEHMIDLRQSKPVRDETMNRAATVRERVPPIGDSAKDGVLVVPGDMPTVPLTAYKQAMEVYNDDPSKIIIATHNGKRGHPMIFPKTLATVLFDIQGGLNELPRRFPDLVRSVDVSDPGVVRDIDRPDDYEMLKAQTEPRP